MLKIGLSIWAAVLRVIRAIIAALTRNDDGTVTIQQLPPVWTASVVRNDDGTVTIDEV